MGGMDSRASEGNQSRSESLQNPGPPSLEVEHRANNPILEKKIKLQKLTQEQIRRRKVGEEQSYGTLDRQSIINKSKLVWRPRALYP